MEWGHVEWIGHMRNRIRTTFTCGMECGLHSHVVEWNVDYIHMWNGMRTIFACGMECGLHPHVEWNEEYIRMWNGMGTTFLNSGDFLCVSLQLD